MIITKLVQVFEYSAYRQLDGRSYTVRIKSSKKYHSGKPEFDDIKSITVKENISLREGIDEVTEQVRQKYR
jgi:uncharacterized protein (DUF111 family)